MNNKELGKTKNVMNFCHQTYFDKIIGEDLNLEERGSVLLALDASTDDLCLEKYENVP
jgi:hypothetical protein